MATTVNYVDRNVLSFTMINDTFRKEMLHLLTPKLEPVQIEESF